MDGWAMNDMLTVDHPLHLQFKTTILIFPDSLTFKPLIMRAIASPCGILVALLLAVL
jgi:hypothetical protein